MNFYVLSQELNIDVKLLFEVYNKLFPKISIYDYTVSLKKDEINQIKSFLSKD